MKTEDVINGMLLERLVLNITNTEATKWEHWYKVAQAVFNEGGTEELFLRWSALSPKHNEREAIKNGLKKLEWVKEAGRGTDGGVALLLVVAEHGGARGD